MQKNSTQNKNDSTMFDAPPSQHFFQEKSQTNNSSGNNQQPTDLDSPNKESENKYPQQNSNQNESTNPDQNINTHERDSTNKKTLERQGSSSINKEKYRRNNPNFMKVIQRQTNFPAVYVILPILFCGICVYFGFMEVFFTNLIGIIFPIYWSMRALDTDINSKDEEKQWYTYWVIFLGMLPIDMLFGRFLRHIPLLYFFKYVFLCWLFLPNFYGASSIHDRLIKKNLPQFEIVYRIDNASNQIKKEFKDFTTRLQTRMMESRDNEGLKRKKSRGVEKKHKSHTHHNEPVEYEYERGHEEYGENHTPQMNKENEKLSEDQNEKPSKKFQTKNQNHDRQEESGYKNKEKKQNLSRSNEYQNEKENKDSQGKSKRENNEEERKMGKNSQNAANQQQQQKEKKMESENKEKNKENKESTNYFVNSEAEKSDVSNAYENLISHIHEIKSRSGKTKDLINSTIEKIWGRLHEESMIRKANQEKDLFETETDKRRYEEQMREINANDSEKFGVDVNKGFPVQEEETRKFFEKNDLETKDNLNSKDNESNKVGLDKDIDKDYPNKDENFKIKGERKIKENEDNKLKNNENKENIQTENIEPKNKKTGVHEPSKEKNQEKKQEKTDSNWKDKSQMVAH